MKPKTLEEACTTLAAAWGNRIQIRGSRKDSSSIFPRYSYLESFRPCPAARLSGWGTGRGVRA